MDVEYAMPPAVLDPGAETDDEKRRKLAFMPPASAAPAQPQTPAPSPAMPAANPAPIQRAQPTQTGPSMPPAGLVRNPLTGVKSESGPMDEIPKGMPPGGGIGPQTQRYQDLSKQPAPELHGWKKALDVIGSMFPIGRGIEEAIPGSPQNYSAKLTQAGMRAAKEQAIGKEQAEEGRAAAGEKRAEEEAPVTNRLRTAQAREAEARAADLENPKDAGDKKIDEYVNKEGKRVLTFQKPDGTTYDRVGGETFQKDEKTPNAKEDLQRQIAAADAKGDKETVKTLQARLKAIDPEGQQRINIQMANQNPDDAKAIADAIRAGDQPPTTTGLYRNASKVRAELARSGFNLAQAESDWRATQKHLATMNGAQQERLRQAVGFTRDSLSQVEDIYNQWQKVGKTSGWKAFNKASLETAKQLPGEPGNLAHRLEARVADLTSELGTVYKGGNSSTDESLKLAAKNLEGDWNEKTFKDAIGDIRKSIEIRENSIKHSRAQGVSENSPYTPPEEGGGSAFDKWKASRKQ